MEEFKLKQYIEEGKSQYEMADIFNCSQTTIVYWLKKYKLQTNRSKGIKKNKKMLCVLCEKEFSPWSINKSMYCSIKCSAEAREKETLSLWLEDKKRPLGAGTLRRQLKKYYKNKCSICGITSWLDKPLNMEVDHIDGDSTNNKFKNLRLLCPNCHAQTPTFKAKNRGNGRYKRAQRYREGKSY